jgi:Holliday junction resolvase-like predicted endonuclease
MLSQELGARAENIVKVYFESKGYRFVKDHAKIYGVEVDLIFKKNSDQKNSETFFVEVKRLSPFAELENRWNYKQKNRFMNMASRLAETNKMSIRCILAMVTSKEGQVLLFENDLEVSI